MEFERPPTLRTGPAEGAEGTPAAPTPTGGFGVNALAELVAALLAATGLVPADKLALVRGRAGQSGSIAQALVDEGIASGEGIARMLAARHQLPLVDLPLAGVEAEAAQAVPLHVLERIVAIPYAIENGYLRVAVADPANIHGIDELRLATRYPLQLADAPLVRLVNSVIFQAAEDGASDIHFEPQEDALIVRFRIDGVLQEVQRIPKRMTAGVTTRLKVLAKLDIAERRKPQDGRISLNAAAAGRMLDVRMATLPTVEGEAVVMRLLDKSKSAPTLTDLGLSEEMRLKMEEIISRPTGAILATGPTGSGKSTTLYAALTRHLVLSTMHTNDAPGAITRLNEMGVEPFLTGSAVSAVLAQRLARKLCPQCCEMYSPSVDELLRNRVSPEVAAASDGAAFYRKRGCPRCGHTGYKGRIGIFQLMVMSEELESLAVGRASREDLEREAIRQGMRTLWDDGLAKVAAGITSLEELGRVLV